MISTSVVSTWFTPTTLFCFLNLMIVIIFLTSRRKKSDDDQHPQIGVDSSTQLLRAPSLLQRVKSINFSFNRLDHYSYSASSVNDSMNVEERHEIIRSKSETVVETPAPPVNIMKSSVSEKDLACSADERRRPSTTTTVRERKGKSVASATTGRSSREDEGVDEKADDFINRFRQQLKLQRLDSILRYKEMLNRGAGR